MSRNTLTIRLLCSNDCQTSLLLVVMKSWCSERTKKETRVVIFAAFKKSSFNMTVELSTSQIVSVLLSLLDCFLLTISDQTYYGRWK